jgi:sterol desaturase/sphingolipid hydroxylase (fatty acid hydroxylase superfamily)
MFLSLFALDAFNESRSFSEALRAFAIHIAPTVLLLAVVAASWRWEWLGGVVFIGLAVVYVAIAGSRLDWILVISGPLLIVGALFLWSWRFHEELHRPRSRS